MYNQTTQRAFQLPVPPLNNIPPPPQVTTQFRIPPLPAPLGTNAPVIPVPRPITQTRQLPPMTVPTRQLPP